MNLSFALPGLLWALAAVALPVLLHLVRRERQQKTVFAALAWLDPRQRPRRRLRLREWLLLLLRLLLVAALVMLLAGLRRDDPPGPQAMRLVHPALRAPTGEPPPGEQWAWLAPGFPAVGTPAPRGEIEVPSLLREIDHRLPADTRLAVQVPSLLDGLDAAPIRLARPVDWQVQALAPTPTPAPDTPRTPLALALRGVGGEDATRWLRAVHDIPGGPPGAYWDGGITDYHLHLPYASMDEGLVLYPHFQASVVPGWLDKPWKRRHRATALLDNLVLLSPDPAWVATLPGSKLPDRQDFKAYGDDIEARQRAWRRALDESRRLADEFAAWAHGGDADVRPLGAD